MYQPYAETSTETGVFVIYPGLGGWNAVPFDNTD